MLIELLIIVLFCTFIQNIFGVGILVFGTPTLLMLGYDYMVILGVLLPSSLVVSLAQVFLLKDAHLPEINIILKSMAGVFLGAVFLSFYSVPIFIYLITAITMFFAAFIRFSTTFRLKISSALASTYLQFHFLNAAFHGFSNLGGILLVLKNNVENSSKQQSLLNTASIYLIYVISQIFVLSAYGNYTLFTNGIIIAPFALVLNVALGVKPLASFSARQMDFSLGAFFILAGCTLAYKFVSIS